MDRSIDCWGAKTNPIGPHVGTFVGVAAGNGFVCGLRDDGTLACWGSDGHGILSKIPVGEFVQLVAGDNHACAIRKDNRSVVCWGAGDADAPNFNDPDMIAFAQAVPPPGRFVQLAAGFGHTCGILEDGSVKCWGAGTTVDNCETTLQCGQSIPAAGAFVEIAAGTSNSCGVRADGSLACWGSNLGNRSTPPSDLRAF